MGGLMTFKEAAAVTLREAREPLHYEVITTRALQGSLIESQGRTPASTMGNILSQDIKENGPRSEFVHHGNGMYGLNPGYAAGGKQKQKPKRKGPAPGPRGGGGPPAARGNSRRLLGYIESEVDLGTNHELVILRHLLRHVSAHHGELAEELARHNGLNDSDIGDVQKFIGVPQLQRLERLGFIASRMINGQPASEWALDLGTHDAAAAMEALISKLGDYQQKHGLPEDPKRGRGIDWRLHADRLRPSTDPPQPDPGGGQASDTGLGLDSVNSWIWSVNEENFKILQDNLVWASQADLEKIQGRVKPGDLVAFYLIGNNGFVAVYRFVGNWYRSPGPMWADESKTVRHKSQVRIKKVKEGFVSMDYLENKLSIFQDKSDNRHQLKLRSSGGYPGNNGHPIPAPDMRIILDALGRGNSVLYGRFA